MREIIQHCPHCNTSIGRLVEINNVIYLDTGSGMIERGFTYCHACGYKFSFIPPRQSFDKLKEQAQRQQSQIRLG